MRRRAPSRRRRQEAGGPLWHVSWPYRFILPQFTALVLQPCGGSARGSPAVRFRSFRSRRPSRRSQAGETGVRSVPGTVVTLQQPPPIGAEGANQNPDRFAHCAGKVCHRTIDGYHHVKQRNQRGGIRKVAQFVAEMMNLGVRGKPLPIVVAKLLLQADKVAPVSSRRVNRLAQSSGCDLSSASGCRTRPGRCGRIGAEPGRANSAPAPALPRGRAPAREWFAAWFRTPTAG